MNHVCTRQTDLDELIGIESGEGSTVAFHYGPLPLAMAAGEELVLENSRELSPILSAKLRFLLKSLRIEETDQLIRPRPGFRITLG